MLCVCVCVRLPSSRTAPRNRPKGIICFIDIDLWPQKRHLSKDASGARSGWLAGLREEEGGWIFAANDWVWLLFCSFIVWVFYAEACGLRNRRSEREFYNRMRFHNLFVVKINVYCLSIHYFRIEKLFCFLLIKRICGTSLLSGNFCFTLCSHYSPKHTMSHCECIQNIYL